MTARTKPDPPARSPRAARTRSSPRTSKPINAPPAIADAPLDTKRYRRIIDAGELYLEHRATGRVYWYNAAHGDAAAAFFPTFMRLTKGKWFGHPFRLEPWQSDDFIRPLFGWKRVIDGQPRKDWPRRYRRARKWVPRKNGKTEILAGTANLLLAADEEPGAEVYAIASKRDQARLVFETSQRMAMQDGRIANHLEFLKTSTYCGALASVFRPLSGNPEGTHGLNAHACLGDEVHEWQTMDLHTFVTQSMGARRQPLDITISTAGKRGTVGRQFYEECEQIAAGAIDDPETLVTIYAADADDDWTDPKTWAKANPNLGVSVSLEYLQDACRQAQQLPRLENDFKRYHLNIWTEQDVRWLPMAAWRACDRSADGDLLRWQRLFDDLKGRKCYGGLDLASIQDITALCWYFPPTATDPKAVLLWRFWVPADTVAERSKRDQIPYDQWVASGAITATPGNITDYNRVRQDIDEDRQRFDVQKIGLDKFNSSQMVIDLMADGAPAVWFPQSMMSMSPPSKQLERMVLAAELDHGGHPVARWMASNVAVISDHNDNIRPSKEKSSEKIDGIAAAVIAIGMTLGEPPPPQSYTATSGLLII
jgi:phage terminase large subunit-like protein